MMITHPVLLASLIGAIVLLVAVILLAVCLRSGGRAWRWSDPASRIAFIAAAIVLVLYGGAKREPDDDDAAGDGADEPSAQEVMLLEEYPAYRQVGTMTETGHSFAMPSNAVQMQAWNLHGAHEAWTTVDFPDESFTAFTGGYLRMAPRVEDWQIGLPGSGRLQAGAGFSRLWWKQELDGTKVVTWQDLLPDDGRGDPVSVQVRLGGQDYAYVVWSNDVCRCYEEIYNPKLDESLSVQFDPPSAVYRGAAPIPIPVSLSSLRPLEGTVTLRAMGNATAVTMTDDIDEMTPLALPHSWPVADFAGVQLAAFYTDESSHRNDVTLELKLENEGRAKSWTAWMTAVNMTGIVVTNDLVQRTNSDRMYIPFRAVADNNLHVDPLEIDVLPVTHPADFPVNCTWSLWSEVTHVCEASGGGPFFSPQFSPASGEYRIEADGPCEPVLEWIAMPSAGADITAVMVRDFARADAFVARVRSLFGMRWFQRPYLGFGWFCTRRHGYYAGRPDNPERPTLRELNQVRDNDGLGAVVTLYGIPVRLEKMSNLIAAYVCESLQVPLFEQMLSQSFGTPNAHSADQSWFVGMQIAQGADFATSVSNLVWEIWHDEADDAKLANLWPNPAPAVNHEEFYPFYADYDNRFYSPGFLGLYEGGPAGDNAVTTDVIPAAIELIYDEVMSLFGLLRSRSGSSGRALIDLWESGAQSNVLAIAEARLALNPNDPAGVFLKASWDFDFSDGATLSNSLVRALSVGETITTPVFTNVFALTRIDMAGTMVTLGRETPEQRAADAAKVQGAGHPMAYGLELLALEADGLFTGNASDDGADDDDNEEN